VPVNWGRLPTFRCIGSSLDNNTVKGNRKIMCPLAFGQHVRQTVGNRIGVFATEQFPKRGRSRYALSG